MHLDLVSVCVVLCCMSWVQCQAVQQCVAPKQTTRHVRISNHRNKTGHLISEIDFPGAGTRTSGPGTRDTHSWQVDVEQHTDSCEGAEVDTRVRFTLSVPMRRSTPDSDYELFPSVGYYKFHDDVQTWPRAREICAEEGTHLVIINSEIESGIMTKLFARYPVIKGTNDNNWAWVGIIEKANGKYMTIFGEPLNITGFERWSPSEPNNPSNGDYILVNRVNGGLADIPVAAGWKQAFICELEIQ